MAHWFEYTTVIVLEKRTQKVIFMSVLKNWRWQGTKWFLTFTVYANYVVVLCIQVGTKSSVDNLVPKSDELLTQTQRQERAISEIHSDLRLKTNQIIENLEGVESRLKKQEDDVAILSQRPIPAELLLDPTIDRLVEYDPTRLVVFWKKSLSKIS